MDSERRILKFSHASPSASMLDMICFIAEHQIGSAQYAESRLHAKSRRLLSIKKMQQQRSVQALR